MNKAKMVASSFAKGFVLGWIVLTAALGNFVFFTHMF